MEKGTSEYYACIDMLFKRYRHLPKYEDDWDKCLEDMQWVVDKGIEIVG